MENAMYAGLTASLDIDDNFRDYFGGSSNGGGASFGLFDGGEEKAVQMGFKSFQYGGYTFHKKSYKAFNHIKLLGYTDSGSVDVGCVVVNAAAGSTVVVGAGSTGAGAIGSGSIGCAVVEGSDTMYEVSPADGKKNWSPSKLAVTT